MVVVDAKRTNAQCNSNEYNFSTKDIPTFFRFIVFVSIRFIVNHNVRMKQEESSNLSPMMLHVSSLLNFPNYCIVYVLCVFKCIDLIDRKASQTNRIISFHHHEAFYYDNLKREIPNRTYNQANRTNEPSRKDQCRTYYG